MPVEIERSPEQLAKRVFSGTGANIEHALGLDPKLSWVKSYVKDQKCRDEIAHLQQEIVEVQRLPIDRDELRAMLERRIEEVNGFRLQQLRIHLASVQRREEPLLPSGHIGPRKVCDAVFLPYLIRFSADQLDSIFDGDGLEVGVKQSDIQARVGKCQNEISRLQKTIETELSPQTRWFYDNRGHAERYPTGCRWHLYARTWSIVARRLKAPCDIHGYELRTPEQHEAYGLLELGRLSKIEPLGAPVKISS